MVELVQLIGELPGVVVSGPIDGVVTAVAYNAAGVVPGALFVAVRGRWHDGHAFIADAVAHKKFVAYSPAAESLLRRFGGVDELDDGFTELKGSAEGGSKG